MIEIAFVLTRKRARFIFPKSTVFFFPSFAPLLRPVFISRGEGRGSFKTRQPRDLCFYSRSMVFLRDIGKTFREREKISAKLYVCTGDPSFSPSYFIFFLHDRSTITIIDYFFFIFHANSQFSLSLSLCIILTFEKRVFKESITKPKLIPRFYCYLSLYNFNILLGKRIFKEFLNLSLELEKILIAIIIISESLEGVVHQFVNNVNEKQPKTATSMTISCTHPS